MLEIRRGTAAEFDEIIDFIDFVFSKNGSPHDFPAMYPNLYRRTDESISATVNLYDDGRIIGSVLAHPRRLSVGGRELGVVGIGSVAAHPRIRGKGIMTRLMSHIVAELKKDGVALSMLGGKRSRYNHFGYELGGIGYGLRLSPDAVAAAFGTDFATAYTFRAFAADDRETAAACKRIYETQPVHYSYGDDAYVLRFFDWHNRAPYAVYNADNALIGYLAMGEAPRETRGVSEFAFTAGADAAEIIAAYVLQMRQNVHLCLCDWQMAPFAKLIRIGGGHSIGPTAMWNVLDWQAVLEAFLTLKASYTALEEGTLVLDIAESGKWKVTVSGKTVAVTATNQAADLSLSALDAVFALTGPAPTALIGCDQPTALLRLVRSWFPLPLTGIDADRV